MDGLQGFIQHMSLHPNLSRDQITLIKSNGTRTQSVKSELDQGSRRLGLSLP